MSLKSQGVSTDQSSRTAELVARLRSRGDQDDAGLVEELLARHDRKHEQLTHIEDRLGRSRDAFSELARCTALSEGHRETAFAAITEKATQILDVGRAGIWLYSNDRTAITCHDLYQVDMGKHERDFVLRGREFPRYFEALRHDRVVAAHDAYTDPRTSEFASSYLPATGVGALLDAPIRIGDQMLGVLCVEHLGPARTWTSLEEHLAGALADVAALAIERQRRVEREQELSKLVELLEQHNSTIEQQRVAIADLSVPLVDVWDGIVALPIVGALDERRSEIMTQQLLQRIANAHVRVVIIDVTGVETIDAATAHHLLQMLRAVSLLGAKSMMSGITPKIARTLIELNVELRSIRTVPNLASALRTCIG